MKDAEEQEKYRLAGHVLRQQSSMYVNHESRNYIQLSAREGPRVSLINAYARRLAKANDPPLFSLTGYGPYWAPHCINGGQMIKIILDTDFVSIRNDYRYHRQSPFFNAIEKEINALRELHGKDFLQLLFYKVEKEIATSNLEALNFIVAQLKARIREVRVEQANFVRGAAKNYRSVIASFQAAMRRRVRMTICRIDLSYSKGIGQVFAKNWEGDVVSLEKLQIHRDAFSAHLEEKFKSALIDYTWAIEYGADRKWHAHCVIMLDHAKHQQDVNIVRALGEHWKEVITAGRGHFWNCNANKKIYKYLALGAVNVNDESVRIGLRFIAAYLTLAGVFVKLDLPEKFRVLGGTIIKKTPNAKVGRPSACNAIPLWQGFAKARDGITWM